MAASEAVPEVQTAAGPELAVEQSAEPVQTSAVQTAVEQWAVQQTSAAAEQTAAVPEEPSELQTVAEPEAEPAVLPEQQAEQRAEPFQPKTAVQERPAVQVESAD